MTNINHAELESIARQMCESKRGTGAWDRPRCKRTHWRRRALPLAQVAAEPQGIGKTLMRAIGWQL